MNTLAKPRFTQTRVIAIRPMTRDDIQFLRERSSRPIIAKLRDSHHNMARMFASGLPPAEIAAKTGYSLMRVYTLRTSPAMIELVEKYRAKDDDAWREARDEYHTMVHAAGMKAWRQINDALEEADDEGGEKIAINKLLAIADSSADRVGYHRKSTKENINVDFAARLEKAIGRSREVNMIDATPNKKEVA